MPTYIRSKINTDLPVEITLNSEGSETILNQDGTFRLPGVGSSGTGSLRVVDSRVEVKLSTGEWKQIIVGPDLATVALSGLFSDLVSIPTTISGYGITDAYTKTQVDIGISTAINNLVDGAPDLLNTLKELSQALNNDAGFAGTITSSLSQKLDKSGGVMTGLLTLSANPTNSLHAATKQYVDTYVNDSTSSAITNANSDNFEEGEINLYYTTARVNSAFDTRLALKSTSDLTEGTNKYYTDTRARAAISVTGNGSYDSTTGVITISSGGVGNVISVNAKTGTIVLTTSDITEGTNQYFTPARARSAISVAGSGSYDNTTGVITINGGVTSVNTQTGAVTLSTTNINEGTNLYYTDSRFDAQLATKTTSNLAEGANKYYTDARARAAISVGGSLSYNSSTGTISYSTPNSDAVSEGSTNRYFTPGRARSSVSAGSGISYSSDTGIIAVNTGVIATKNDLTTTNVTEGTNLYYTIDRTKDDGFATKAYVDGQVAQVSLNVINTIDNVNSFMRTTAVTTAGLITLVDSISSPAFAQSNWNETNSTKLDYIKNKPSLANVATSGNYNDLTNKPSIPSINGLATETYVTSRGYLTTVSYADLTGKPVLFSGSYNDLTNKPTLFPGDYNSLINKPTLFSGAYADLTGRPTLFGGSYNDLTDKPALFSGGYNDLTNKPVLFSGSYNDLTNKPSIPAAQVQSDWNATSSLGQILNKPLLANVATSGSYNDLSNKPDVSNTARSSVSAGIGIDYNSSTGVIASTITQYTDTMARNTISSGTGINYNSSTGVITNTITQYTDTMSKASLSAGTGISYNNSTGVITNTITQYTDAMARTAISSSTGLTYNPNTGVITNTITQYTDTMARGAISVEGSLNYDNSTGIISYTTPNTNGIVEGATNKYFTNTRARAAISVSGSLSYNNSTGVISYTTPSTTGIVEGTNLYYTDTRARAAISAGTGISYNSSTGVITNTITQYTDIMARGALSATGDLDYTSSTGVISFTQNKAWSALTGTPTTISGYGITNSYTKTEVDSAITTAVAGKDNTDEITEGTTNLYFTNARARGAVSAGTGISYNSTTGVITNTISQYTDTMARNAVSVSGSLSYNNSTGVISYTTPSTTDIVEGTNLYYTDTRARAAISAGTGINYNSSTGSVEVNTNVIAAKAYLDGQLSRVSLNVDNLISTVGSYIVTNSATTATLIQLIDSVTSSANSTTIDGGNITFDGSTAGSGSGGSDSSGNYSLPVATTLTLGGVRVDGSTITITEDGTIRAAVSSFNGNYDSLNNKPTYAAVATSGSYNDLINKPTYAAVATSGSYNDLTNKPSIPAAQVQSNWTATSGVTQILNKPTLSTVATSGRYDDLIGSPLPYDLPKATTARLGGVKVDGTSIISTDGILSLATTVTGSLTGNASTASKLATARTINGVSFDGSANITVKATATNALTIGTGLSGTSYDGSSAVTIANTGVTSIAGTAGQISASANTGGITLSLPNSMTVPGSLTVTGNLTVSGTTTTINSSILSVADLNIEVAKNAATAADANNAGLIVVGANAALLYTSSTDRWSMNKNLNVPNVYSNLIGNVTGNVSGSAGSVNWSNITGLPTFASSSTTDTTDASNITTGILSNSRLSAIPNNALANSSITINGQSVNLGGNLTVSAQAPNSLTIGSYLTGSSYNGSTAVTIAVDAASANTASKVVARDASGNFSAGTITANFVGNASTATKLATARTINGVSFDGSSNITVHSAGTGIGISGTTVTNLLATSGGAIGGNIAVTGDVTATGDIVSISGNFVGDVIGNASTATTLQNTRTISGVNFNGSANITLTTTGITEGTNLYYTDARARAAHSFTAGSGAYNSTTGVFTIPTNNNQLANGAGYITGITGNNVITALGYTPYSASNPSGYTNNTGTITSITGGSYLTGGTITSSGTLAVDATSANTASKVVARDASGNFSAGTITANTSGTHTGAVSGNATTATTLQTARNINGVSFNGSADVTVHTAGTGIGISGTTVTNLLATSGGAIGGAIAVTGSITATGDVTAYYSDARLKTEIEPITDPISKVMSLRGVTFRPNQTALDLGITDREEVGVIAQEVETVLPQLVVDSGYEGYKTVKYDKLTALLIEAVKNQQVQIDELKQEIKRLKNG